MQQKPTHAGVNKKLPNLYFWVRKPSKILNFDILANQLNFLIHFFSSFLNDNYYCTQTLFFFDSSTFTIHDITCQRNKSQHAIYLPIYSLTCQIWNPREQHRISSIWNTLKGKTTWQIEAHSKCLEGQANTNAHNQHSWQGWLIALGLRGSIASCRLKCVHLCGSWIAGWCWGM